MKTRSLFLAGAVLIVIAAGISGQQKTSQDLTWAFPQLVAAKELKPVEDDGKPRRVPGSNKGKNRSTSFLMLPIGFPGSIHRFRKRSRSGSLRAFRPVANATLLTVRAIPNRQAWRASQRLI